MADDSITEEIRVTRRSLAAKFGNDVTRILADVRKQQAASGRQFVRHSKRPPITAVVAEQTDAGEPK